MESGASGGGFGLAPGIDVPLISDKSAVSVDTADIRKHWRRKVLLYADDIIAPISHPAAPRPTVKAGDGALRPRQTTGTMMVGVCSTYSSKVYSNTTCAIAGDGRICP